MSVEILEHEFVPKHEIMPKKEAKEILEKFNTTKDKLPRIFITDPVARKIGAKQGDIIKITRKSPVAGESEYYRFVV